MDSGRFLRNTLHLPVKSHIIPVPLRTSSITCSFLSFYTEITQDLDLEERSVNGKDGDTIVPTISLSPRVGMASEHFLLATRLVFQRLLEGLWIQSREGKAERALPSPSLSLPCASGPLEHVHLSLPFVTTKNKEVNATAVLWPSQVGTLTYVWWYGNNTEVSQLSARGLCGSSCSSKGKEMTYTTRVWELGQPREWQALSASIISSACLCLSHAYTPTSYPCLPVSQRSSPHGLYSAVTLSCSLSFMLSWLSRANEPSFPQF